MRQENSSPYAQADYATLHPSHPSPEQFLLDVRNGLSLPRKSLPCKYLYDENGSALFDQICELPEYYLTRTEAQIMSDNADAIAAAVGRRAVVVELGSGSSTKTRILLDSLADRCAYLPVDISQDHLLRTASNLRDEYPDLMVEPIVADFMHPFEISPRYSDENITLFFPGSTIGNLTEPQAEELLRGIRDLRDTDGVRCEPRLLVGFDLAKAHDVLEAAYNDAAGVSAQFSLNLLRRINEELSADFNLSAFEHYAYFNHEDSRIEIFLRSLMDQSVTVGDQAISFSAGELIHTEYSHKYTIDRFAALARRAGFDSQQCWTDEKNYFAVMLLDHLES